MNDPRSQTCPDCQSDAYSRLTSGAVSRRGFLQSAAIGAIALGSARILRADEAKTLPVSETKVKELYDSLSADQRKVLCFSMDDPLVHKAQANWAITEPKIEDLTEVQQDMVESIVHGLMSEQGKEMFTKQMEDDGGGLSQYHIALFGKPGEEKFEFVFTGRHSTMRADGNFVDKVAFAGPMVYGHAAAAFNEPADHKGNVFWYQGVRANEVFHALDPDQRKIALVERAPKEDMIEFRSEGYQGLAVGAMKSDQRELVQQVMKDLLAPYRQEDVDEVMQCIAGNGGLEKIHLAFYAKDEANKNADIGKDGIWDIWRLEGPGFVWHFRGYPHVHTWVNIKAVG